MNDAVLLVWFCLVIAETDTPRTVYHDRIDGLLMPSTDPFDNGFRFWPE